MPLNPNAVFRDNWYKLGPHALDLRTLDPGQRRILTRGEVRAQDALLPMDEARDHLIQQSRLRDDAEGREYLAVLNSVFGELVGQPVDLMSERQTKAKAHVLYHQLNNPTNARLQEAIDLERIVRLDQDAPALDTINLTRQFNTAGDVARASAAFKESMIQYLDGLRRRGERMNGYVISGHSNGRAMLEEMPDHSYRANLYPREVLLELRNSNPEYARLFDGVEKVALLACFQGGATQEWRMIFPNAVICGTKQFAPLSSTEASGEIYKAAFQANELREKNWRTSEEQAIAEGLRLRYRTFLTGRGLVVDLPKGDRTLIAAQDELRVARQSYGARLDELRGIRNHPERYNQGALDLAYSVVNTYLIARRQVWTLQGQPEAETNPLLLLDYLKDDFFAIRKHQPRPAVPAGAPADPIAYVA